MGHESANVLPARAPYTPPSTFCPFLEDRRGSPAPCVRESPGCAREFLVNAVELLALNHLVWPRHTGAFLPRAGCAGASICKQSSAFPRYLAVGRAAATSPGRATLPGVDAERQRMKRTCIHP